MGTQALTFLRFFEEDGAVYGEVTHDREFRERGEGDGLVLCLGR